MKQLIYYYLCLKVLVKAAVCGYLFVTDSGSLPMAIFGICAALVFSGAIVAVRHFKNKATDAEIGLYFLADALMSVANLVFISQAVMLEGGMLEMIVTGSLLDVIIGVIVFGAAFKSKLACSGAVKRQVREAK